MKIKNIAVVASLCLSTLSLNALCPCAQRAKMRAQTSDHGIRRMDLTSTPQPSQRGYQPQGANQRITIPRAGFQQQPLSHRIDLQQMTTQRAGAQTNYNGQNGRAKNATSKQPAMQQQLSSPAGMSIELVILSELNTARTNPQGYISYLLEHKKSFTDQKTYRYGQYTIPTKEGVAVVDETIRFLKRMQPQERLTFSDGLTRAANDHVLDIGPKGILGHIGSDRSNPGTRVSRYGSPMHAYGENIAFGHSDARQIVMQLIIDDGVKDRGHRTNIFNPDFHRVGIAYGGHKSYRCMCVIDFAGEFIER